MSFNSNAILCIHIEIRNNTRKGIKGEILNNVSVSIVGSSSLKSSGFTELQEYRDNLTFKKGIETNYHFYKNKQVEVTVYMNNKLRQEIFLGSRIFNAWELLKGPNLASIKDKKGKVVMNELGKETQVCISTTNKMSESRSLLLKISLKDLKKAKLYPNKFELRFYKLQSKNPTRWKLVNNGPSFNRNNLTTKEFRINYKKLTDDDLDKLLNVSLFNGKKIIADTHFTLRMKETLRKAGVPMRVTKEIGRIKNHEEKKIICTLVFDKIKIREKVNFVSYLMGGQTFTAIYAVDLSKFNESESRLTDLHSPDPEGSYLKTIRTLDSTMRNYSKDRKSLLWGFGAEIKGEKGIEVSNAFCMSFDENILTCDSYEIMEEQYINCIKRVRKSTKRNLREIIITAGEYAKNRKDEYITVFLMTTPQAISTASVLEALNSVADKPVSFIFIGMGPGNFNYFKKFQHESSSKKNRENSHFFSYEKVERSVKKNEFPRYLLFNSLSYIPKQFLKYAHQFSQVPNSQKKSIINLDATRKEETKYPLGKEKLNSQELINNYVPETAPLPLNPNYHPETVFKEDNQMKTPILIEKVDASKPSEIKQNNDIKVTAVNKFPLEERMQRILNRWSTVSEGLLLNFTPEELEIEIFEFISRETEKKPSSETLPESSKKYESNVEKAEEKEEKIKLKEEEKLKEVMSGESLSDLTDTEFKKLTDVEFKSVEESQKIEMAVKKEEIKEDKIVEGVKTESENEEGVKTESENDEGVKTIDELFGELKSLKKEMKKEGENDDRKAALA